MATPPPPTLSLEKARSFHRAAVLLDHPRPTVESALSHLGYVQIDPIQVCGRMHDHILRNRVLGYAEGALMRHLHGEDLALAAAQRSAFEHHLPDSAILAAFPLDTWPHLLAAMRRRTRGRGAWSGHLTAREQTLAGRLLAEIAARGPLSSADFDDDRKSRQASWGAFSLVKMTLQKLFFHGRLLIARRQGNRRLYDLPEKVLPASVLGRPEPDAGETARWLVALKLRQRRLARLTRTELPLVEDLVRPLRVGDGPPLYCLREDLPLLDAPEGRVDGDPAGSRRDSPLLLAPLDPLIYDRALTRLLWDFDYTWEVYKPAPKRVRGYYALPVLDGLRLAGTVDLAADRGMGRLRLVQKNLARGFSAQPAIRQLASFLGLEA